MAWIYDKNGQQKCEVKKLSYNGVFMDVSSITVTIESPSPIDFAIGDYIDWDYDGMRYTLDAAAAVEKQARRNSVGNAFIYENLVFLSPLSAAGLADFLDVVIGNQIDFHTNTEFSFFGTAWDYAKRLEANLCRLYGAGTWKVRIWTDGVCYDSAPATLDTGAWEGKLVDVSRIKCLAGFQQIYDLWGCAYVFSVVDGVNYVDFYDDFELYAKAWEQGGVAKIFAYGKGNGLYKIRHTQDADHVLVTRLRAYGSSENIPANYYLNSPLYHVDGNESSELAIANLMLPSSEWTNGGVKHPSNAYIEQNVDLYGVREASVYWDGSDSELGEIKTTIYKLTIQDLLSYMSAGEPYRPVESKWPDTTQRIDEIITGAQPTDNGVVKEAGYDFTVVALSLSFLSRDLGDMLVDKEVKFGDLVMSALFPMISDLAEYRLVPQGDDHRVVSFVVPGANASSIRSVSAYITPYIGTRMVENATIPMKVVPRAVTVDNATTMHYEIFLEDSSENFIVFSASRTGALRFSIRALIDYTTEDHETFEVHRYEHALNFNVVRGGKVIDKFFSVIVPQVGFDLAAAVNSGSMLCMRSGYNQPREFPIVPSSVRYNADSDTWYVRCKRVPDDSIGTYFPNSDAPIEAGDEYYFTGIAMPALFVEIAAQRLLSAASAWLARHSKPRMLSSVDVDNKIMAEEGIVLKEGMSLPLDDTDLGITPGTQESRVIENIRIEEGESSIRTFSITLRDKKERSSLDAAIRGATSGLATTSSVNAVAQSVQQQEHGSLSGRDMPDQHPISSITGLEEALMSNSFFELDDNGNVKLKDQYPGLWAQGFIAAGGVGSSGGGGGEGASLLEVWRSLTNNPQLVDSDITSTLKIAAAHIPIGSGLTVNSQGLIDVTVTGTVTSVAGVSPVGGNVPASELADALGLDTVSRCLQSLQSQIDSVASKDDFDELNATVLHADMLSASGIYAEAITLKGADLSTTLTGLSTAIGNEATARANADSALSTAIGNEATARANADSALASGISTLNGYFTNGAANNALKLGGQLPSYYATASALSGVSDRLAVLEARQNWDEIFGIDENGNVYIKQYQVDGETRSRGFWGYSFVTAGGTGSSGGGGGGGIDLPRVWESLTNNTDFPDTKINPAHIPDMATIYGYLKGNQQITLTGVVAGSGTTSITTSIADGALTISMVNGLQNALNAKQDTIGDLQNIRTQAAHGETAYNSLGTISDCLQSLQSQIDSVASRDGFDELTATVLFADMISTPSIYVENLSLNGNDLAGALSNLSSRATSLEGRASSLESRATSLESRATSLESRATSLEGKFTGDSANSALRLAGTSAYSIWGVEYWANGVPKSVTGRPGLFIGSTQVQTSNSPQPLAGITTLTASGLATIAGGISLGGTFEGVDSKIVWDATNSAWHLIGNFYADGFIVAGGIGSGGGGGDIDLPRVWESLTNNTDFPNVTINPAHIPDMASTYGYLKSITSAMVVSALGYTPFSSANFTKANIQSTLGISDWALAASKPSYSVSEITGLQSALDEKQPVISDLDTIRTNAAHGEAAYNSLSMVSVVLQSLQSQIDSVASRDCFDELTASVFHSDMVAAFDLYAGAISLNGADLATSLSGLSTAIANEATARANAIAAEVTARNTAIANAVNALDSATEAVSSGYFLTGVTITDGKITGRAQANSISGNAATATRLADNNSHYLWGVSYWASGVPQDVTTAPNLYIARTKVRASADNDTLLGVTAISNASSSGSTGDETRIEWDATNHAWHFYGGIYADTFVVAGGVGSSGGGSDIDLDRVWESLTNNTDFPDVKINLAHIPDIPWANILSKPTTIAGYGIADAKFGTQGADYVPITLGATTKNVLTAHQSLAAYATKDYVGQQGFITKAVNDLTNYYTKTQTYTRAEVNDLIGSINQFHYEIAASTGAVTDPQSNVLYLIGPTGSGSDKYEEYVYTTQWVKIGDTSIDLTPYLTKTLAEQTYQPIISDLDSIISNAAHGEAAYNSLTTVSAILQSLQSQVDSVASRDTFDELTATAFYSDVAAVSDLYVGAVSLNGVDLAGSLSSLASRATSLESRATALEGRASTLEGYFSSGSAKSALRLTTVSKTAWGQTYWTSGGVPDSISGNMSSVGSISMNGSISGVTSITASGLIKTTNYVQATRFYLTDSIYFVADSNGVKLEGAGFYTDSFVTAGGVGSGGSGGGMDVDRMWQSLTNNPADQGYENTKIAMAHIPDMAATYGYLKGNQTITLTGVVTGSGTTSIATSIADGALTIAKVSGLQAALDSKTGNTGTVTSVGLSVPTGLSVSGSPITTSGTLAITFASGYSIPTTAQQSAWSGKQDAISDLATIRSNAANGATAYSWGNHASAGYLTSANGTTISQALQSLQSQVDSVAARDMFDELSATVLNADTLTATSAYIGTVNGSLSGNATTASYLVSASYGIGGGLNPIYFSGGRPVASTSTAGSASVPVYLNGGTLTAITPSSLFSALSSSAGTNLSMTIAGQTRTATIYATYDSASENISDKLGIVSTALQSLQSQVDSVASRDRFDELTATTLFSDMLSVADVATIGGALTVKSTASVSGNTTIGGTLSVAGNTTIGGTLTANGAVSINNTLTVGTYQTNRATTLNGTLTVSGATTLNGALNVSNTAKIANTLTLGSGVAYPSFFLNANAQSGLKIWGEDAATSYMLFNGGKLGINMTPTNTVDITGTLGVTGLATFAGGVKLTTTKKIWFDDTHYIELDSNGYLHTNAGFYSDSFITAGAANTNA